MPWLEHAQAVGAGLSLSSFGVTPMTAGRRARKAIAAGKAAGAVTVNEVLDGHVVLDLECLDRIYLNGYLPNLQVSGQVVVFLTQHLGNPIPSPALLAPIGERFRTAVRRFAEQQQIPVVRFAKDARKAEVMRPYLQAAEAAGRPGVVAIGMAQEFQRVFTGYDRGRSDGQPGPPRFAFEKADRRVSCYYFYLWDADFASGVHQDLQLLPLPDQGLGQWARMGQAASPSPRDRLRRAGRRVRLLRGPSSAAGDLRPARSGHHRGVLRTLDGAPAPATRRRRPGRRVLVGVVDAPGRGLLPAAAPPSRSGRAVDEIASALVDTHRGTTPANTVQEGAGP